MFSGPRTRHAEILGASLHWEAWEPPPETASDARPVVLLHGVCDSARTWSRVAPVLGRTRRVLALDLPGHGRSGRPDASYSIEWYAQIVTTWLGDLGLEDVDLVGHSLGGGIALRALLERRLRVHRLALVASGGLGIEVAWPLRVAAVTGLVHAGQRWMELGTRAGLRLLGGDFESDHRRELAEANGRPGTARAIARTLRSVIDADGQREHLLDHARRLPELPPIGLFWGERDRVLPVAHVDAARRDVHDLVVHRYEGAGHYPHREASEAFVPALTSFLDEPQRTPRIHADALSPRALRVAQRPAWWPQSLPSSRVTG